jgi:CNT family concentrative nucleoside transporter
MPFSWRLGIGLGIVALASAVFVARPSFATEAGTDPKFLKVQAAAGILCFFSLCAMLSKNLRAVRLRTIVGGILLQFILAMAITHVGVVKQGFQAVGKAFTVMVECSDQGAEFVFGSLSKVNGPSGFVFAFKALPPIIFVSSLFTVLYYLGVLQLLVKLFSRTMEVIMGTSGAETLSVAANVFMGQTEAPLIVKPFVPRMTRSELLALMGSGMAHISGGMMAVYISYGADPVAILSTCVMACPCSLYLTKLLLPETEHPETMGGAKIEVPREHANVIAAAAAGVKDGLMLALNVAAMLIGFLAFIALFDALLGGIKPQLLKAGLLPERIAWLPDDLSLTYIFGKLFYPVAYLMGVDSSECTKVGKLLGLKLAANEHVAYLELKRMFAAGEITERSKVLAVYALSGFANFASVGIQLGGIGAIAEGRKADLAKLGMRALFIGFLTTLINASVAAIIW